MNYEIISNSPDTTLAIGKAFGENAFGGMILLLNGDLGCGKTLLTKGIAMGLDINEVVKSPTYTIVQSYNGALTLNHFDLYRMADEDDFYNIGGYEYLNDNSICVFEWPDIVDWSEYDRLEVRLEYIDENTRSLCLTGFGEEHISFVKKIKKQIDSIIG